MRLNRLHGLLEETFWLDGTILRDTDAHNIEVASMGGNYLETGQYVSTISFQQDAYDQPAKYFRDAILFIANNRKFNRYREKPESHHETDDEALRPNMLAPRVRFQDDLPDQVIEAIDQLEDEGVLEPVAGGNYVLHRPRKAPRFRRDDHGLTDKLSDVLGEPFRIKTGGRDHYVKNSVTEHGNPLLVAVNHHARTMGGRRWPQLERAILARSKSYSGINSARPRMALFKYLNNIAEPWSDGVSLVSGMVERAAERPMAFAHYLDDPEVAKFLYGHKKLLWRFVDGVVTDGLKTQMKAMERANSTGDTELAMKIARATIGLVKALLNGKWIRIPGPYRPLVTRDVIRRCMPRGLMVAMRKSKDYFKNPYEAAKLS